MERIKVKELIDLLNELPDDIKDKEIEYAEFSWVSKDNVLVTLDENTERVIIRED